LDQGCTGNSTCPLGPGPNPLIANVNPAFPNPLFTQYPAPNCPACGNATNGSGDLLNTSGFTFPGNDPTKLDTFIVKLDYKLTANGNQSLFIRGNLQNDHEAKPPQFPGLPPNDFITNNSKGLAAGYTYIIHSN